MRTAKIKQLNKALNRIRDLNTQIDCAVFNNDSAIQIEKLEIREAKACDRAYTICKTMTEEEYNSTRFGDIMCMDYKDAIA